MGKGKSPEPKKRYEKCYEKKRKGIDVEESLTELNWLRSVFNEEKERQKKEQQRLARNARRRARRAEKKANKDR